MPTQKFAPATGAKGIINARRLTPVTNTFRRSPRRAFRIEKGEYKHSRS